MQRSIALVCASNQNRSVEAHALFKKKGFHVHSYGTSSMCKLPGPSADKPNTFPFGTPYAKMHEILRGQNLELYLLYLVCTWFKCDTKLLPLAQKPNIRL